MSQAELPIVILAGSDRRPVELPDEARSEHPLAGYKGVKLRIGGRTLVETLAQRLADTGCFRPTYVVGPSGALAPLGERWSLIDADGTLGENIRVSLETVRRAHPGRAIAFITCDVVPEVETLRQLFTAWERRAPCDLWFPLIQAPDDPGTLGASAWKPAYRIVPRPGEPAVGILPGHLAIVDPAALRLEFLYRLIQVAYRTRNRSINARRWVMVRGVVLALLYQDLRHIATLRAPTLTWKVISVGIATARDLRDGCITRARLEDALRQIFVTSRHRRRYPERRVLLPIVEGLSLALDIDTEEEARALGARVADGAVANGLD